MKIISTIIRNDEALLNFEGKCQHEEDIIIAKRDYSKKTFIYFISLHDSIRYAIITELKLYMG